VRLSFRDASHALDHADNSFADNNEGEQLHALNKMSVLEADDAPKDSDEKYCKAFENRNNKPWVRSDGNSIHEGDVFTK
jgi:hypothetical protein